MIYAIYPFTLDLQKTLSQISIPVTLRDTKRQFLISLTNGGKSYHITDGCRAAFSGTKADGTILYNDCAIMDNTVIRYDFTEQTTAAPGRIDCQINLYGEDGEILASPRFTLNVYKKAVDIDAKASEDEKTSIESMIARESERIIAEEYRRENFDEMMTSFGNLGGIEVSNTKPTNKRIVAWVDSDAEDDVVEIPTKEDLCFVTPQMFGAVGDGVADDTEALKNCFKHNNVFLGNNTYLVSGKVPMMSNMNIVGNDAKIIDTYIGDTFLAESCSNILIYGVNFYGTVKQNKTGTHVIHFVNCENILIDRIKVDGCHDGCVFSSTSYVTVRNSVFCNGTGWVFSFGPNTGKYSHVYVENNECYNCTYDGIKFTGYVSDVIVTGNNCHDNIRDGFDYAGHSVKNFTVCNNIFTNNTEVGVDFKMLDKDIYPYTEGYELYYENVVITNNTISGCYQGINGMYYYDIPNARVVISNNNIVNHDDNYNAHGIRVSPCNFSTPNAVKIQNNNIDVDGVYGVRLGNPKNILVEGNTIRAKHLSDIYINKQTTDETDFGNILISKNHCHNNEGDGAVCFKIDAFSEDGITLSNVRLIDNMFANDRTKSYTIADDYGQTVFINNTYVKEVFSSVPTGRVSANIIYKSSNPATTNCTGWFCKERSSAPTSASFIELF